MEIKIQKRRRTGAALVVGFVSAIALALSLGASLSAFTATITNTVNTAQAGTLAITETGPGATTCNSYDATTTCATINKYGGTATDMAPGDSQTVTVNFANVGTLNSASATLTAGTCTATTTGATGSTTPTSPNTTAGNLCSQVNVKVYAASTATGTPIYNGTAAAFTAASPVTLAALAAGANQDYTFVVSLPAGTGNAVQGQKISQPLTWTFNQ